jgi:hypothetical protein
MRTLVLDLQLLGDSQKIGDERRVPDGAWTFFQTKTVSLKALNGSARFFLLIEYSNY